MSRHVQFDDRRPARPDGRMRKLLVILLVSLVPCLPYSLAQASQRSEVLYSKGLVKFHAGDVAGARELFDSAVRADPDDAHALYYRAMARGRLNDEQGAIDDLKRVLVLDPSIDAAVLELGYLQLTLERHEEADETLLMARSRPAISAEADVLWHKNEQLLSGASEGRRRFRLLGRVGLEYDTNVPLGPDDDALRASLLDGIDESDGRTTVDASGIFSAYSSEFLRVAVRYDFEQSLHFDLDEFDIQTHRLVLDVSSNTGQVHYGVRGSYAYSSNDGDDLVLEGTALPWLRIVEGDWGSTDFYYRMRAQDFLHDPYESLVSGINNAVGARQFFYLGRADRFLLVGYRFDNENREHDAGDALGYDGHQVEAGLGSSLTDRLFAQAIYTYRREEYDSPSTGRKDNEHNVWLRGEAVVTEWASLVANYRLRINDSNKKAFEYDDQIAGLAVELSY